MRATLCLVMLAVGCGANSLNSSREYESASVIVWDPSGRAKSETQTKDRAVVRELWNMLRSAKEATEHKCGSRGQIVLLEKNGTELKLEILPGHDANFYEFRLDRKIYRIPRASFLEILKRIGAEGVPMDV